MPMKIYGNFDDLPCSDQFSIKELFSDIEDRIEDIRWIVTGYGNDDYNLIECLSIELVGHSDNVIARIDDTSLNRDASWVYGVIYHV